MNDTLWTILLILILVFLAAALVLLVILLVRTGRASREDMVDELVEELLEETGRELEMKLDDTEDRLTERVARNVGEVRQDINSRLAHDAEENRRNRQEVSEMISRNQDKLERSLKVAVFEMQETNKQKLSDMQAEINSKLDTSLNQRLDASFRSVGEQLNRLYVSLGELGKLEDGVQSLNKTLSNVKTRGIFGEMQLEHILADILSESLYDKNVVTKLSGGANRDAVEFAVRIPDKEVQGSFMYLPIDSKFPAAAMERIRLASENADAEELQKGIRELEVRVRTDAKDIMEKYLDPPHTTDFGIMFLPTESLYAEVLRIPGLVEDCRSRYHVVITGPTTVAALLNSLSIGFRYMAVNKDSQNILRLLSAIKTQYGTLSKLIETAGNRIDLAKRATEDLQHRTEIINRKLSSVEELDPLEAHRLLGTGESSLSGDNDLLD